jgi:hypothetical protein
MAEEHDIKCRFCGRCVGFEKLGQHLRENHTQDLIQDLLVRVGELEMRLKDAEKQLHDITGGKSRIKLSSQNINEIVNDLTVVLTPKLAAMMKSQRRSYHL